MAENKGKFYMTTAIAYTSGKPHIGNTSHPSAVTGGPVTGLPSHKSSPVPLRSHLHLPFIHPSQRSFLC